MNKIIQLCINKAVEKFANTLYMYIHIVIG